LTNLSRRRYGDTQPLTDRLRSGRGISLAGMKRPRKITLGTMRASGTRNVIVFCADYRCSHSTQISADRWPDDAAVRSRAAVPVSGVRPARRRRAPGPAAAEDGDSGVMGRAISTRRI